MRGLDGVLFSKVRLPSSHKYFCYVCSKLDCVCSDNGDKTGSKDYSNAKQDVAEGVNNSTTKDKLFADQANNGDTASTKDAIATNSKDVDKYVVHYTTSWKRFAVSGQAEGLLLNTLMMIH